MRHDLGSPRSGRPRHPLRLASTAAPDPTPASWRPTPGPAGLVNLPVSTWPSV